MTAFEKLGVFSEMRMFMFLFVLEVCVQLIHVLPALYLWASKQKNDVYEGGEPALDILWVCCTG